MTMDAREGANGGAAGVANFKSVKLPFASAFQLTLARRVGIFRRKAP
jgi:hypothetical protein